MVIAQGHLYWANLPDPELLTEEVGKLATRQLELVLARIDIVLGR